MRFFSIITASALAMAAHATPVNQTDATLVARAPALQLVPEPTPGPGGYKRYFIKATNFQASVVDTVFDVEDPVIGTVLWVEGPKKTPNIAGIAHVTTNLVSCEDRLSDPKTRRATANILEIGSKVRATQTVWIGCDRH